MQNHLFLYFFLATCVTCFATKDAPNSKLVTSGSLLEFAYKWEPLVNACVYYTESITSYNICNVNEYTCKYEPTFPCDEAHAMFLLHIRARNPRVITVRIEESVRLNVRYLRIGTNYGRQSHFIDLVKLLRYIISRILIKEPVPIS